jgi:hypothetical protein
MQVTEHDRSATATIKFVHEPVYEAGHVHEFASRVAIFVVRTEAAERGAWCSGSAS